MTLSEFITNHQGETGFGDTPQNDGQCVGLIERWCDNLGTPHIWGNACDLMTNADRVAYNVIPNTPEGVPAAGDIICWVAGWEGSSVGHTAVIVSADVNSFTVFEQNDRLGGGNGACRTYHFSDYTGVLGWIHPMVLDAPAPVAPAADPAPQTPDPVVVSQPASEPSTPPVVESPTATDPAPVVDVPASPELATPVSSDSPSISVTTPELIPTPDNSQPQNETVRTNKMKIPARLRSRKFWLAVVAAAGFALHGDINQCVAVVLGYFGAQGYVDANQTN